MIKTKRFVIKKFKISLVNFNYFKWFQDNLIKKNIKFKCNNIIDLKKM